MSEIINYAAIKVEDIVFDEFEITKALTKADVEEVWEYNYKLDFYMREHEDSPGRDLLECLTFIKCSNNKKELIYEINATTTFSLKKLKRNEVYEDLWFYFVETSYAHIEGYFQYHVENTLLESKSLPFLNFRKIANINNQIDDLWK